MPLMLSLLRKQAEMDTAPIRGCVNVAGIEQAGQEQPPGVYGGPSSAIKSSLQPPGPIEYDYK